MQTSSVDTTAVEAITINGIETVSPSGDPWTGTINLGEWEQMVSSSYFSIICFYTQTHHMCDYLHTLTDSLSKALFHFYPLAARIWQLPGGRAELCCDSQGVEVIHASSSSNLSDFGDFSRVVEFRPFIPVVNVGKNQDPPLLSVQITRFRCGGLSLGFAVCHGVADGLSAFHFLHEWARIARGESLQTPPIHDRTPLRAGDPPKGPGFATSPMVALPPLTGNELVVFPSTPVKETSMMMLPLSNIQIQKLKTTANAISADDPNTFGRPFTRYEVLTAHLWRCASKVNGSQSDHTKALAITLDARARMNPPLPAHYLGSAVMMVAATINAEHLLNMPIRYTCNVIRETIMKVTDEYIQMDIDELKSLENLRVWRGVRTPVHLSFTMPEIWVVSWLTLPVHGLDFGWGDHVHVSSGPVVVPGLANILPMKIGDGSVIVNMCLESDHVDQFKTYFYENLL